jgi:Tfp pilus assembly protein PilE
MSDIRSFFGGGGVHSQDVSSVYIPTISCYHSEGDIIRMFDKANIGKVSRVDLVPFENPGREGFRQAFVHFNSNTKIPHYIFSKIQSEEGYKLNLNYYKNYNERSTNEYWILLKNIAPVPNTEQNIHQVSHNVKLMEERSAQMEEREALMVKKMEQMEQRYAQMEERYAQMEEKITIMIQLNDKFAKTFDVQTANIQTLSNLLSTRNQPCEQAKPKEKCRLCRNVDVDDNEHVCPDCWRHCEPAIPLTKTGMEAIEQEFTNMKTDAEERYWRLISKNESLALDVSTLYERLWLDVEKLIKKTDKNTTDIADCHERAFQLTNKFKSVDERLYRVIDVVQSVTEQVFDKAITDYKTEVMKFGETQGKMTIDELL